MYFLSKLPSPSLTFSLWVTPTPILHLPDVFYDTSESQMMPDSGWYPIPCPLVLPLWVPLDQAPALCCVTPQQMSTSNLFRKSSDPGNLHAYSRFYRHVTKTLPIPTHPYSHSHEMPTSDTYGVSSSGTATSLTFSRCQSTVGKGFPSLSVLILGVIPPMYASIFIQLFHRCTVPEESLVLLWLSYITITNTNISWSHLVLLCIEELIPTFATPSLTLHFTRLLMLK